jgi:signal transduction histidine kinase
MINTILRNLLSNAIKFTPKSGKIELKSELITDSVLISVSDTGIGITPENIANLFSISEKVYSEGTEKEKGTGLGLILCKEFVEKHGSKIWVESEVGKGSQFKFTMPLYDDRKV